MSRLSALALTALTLLAAACSDPRCPKDRVQDGTFCRRCPDGSEPKHNLCISVDGGGVVDPVREEEEEASGEMEDVDGAADDASGSRQESDGGGSQPPRDASGSPAEGMDAAASDSGASTPDTSVEQDAGPSIDASNRAPDGSTDASMVPDGTLSCVPGACAPGACVGSGAGYTCECPSGFQQVSGPACEDINECKTAHECTAPEYPCRNASGGYSCLGHLASWPMPDGSGSAKATPRLLLDPGGQVAIDDVTELVWQRNVEPTPKGSIFVSAECEGLQLSGHDDWRLPSKVELESLLDLLGAYQAIDSIAFPSLPTEGTGETLSSPFWTSSSNRRLGGLFAVNFVNRIGALLTGYESVAFVRCVRGGRVSALPPSKRYVSTSTEVTDQDTELVWQRTASDTLYSFDDAGRDCDQLGNGYRVPSAKELLTIVDTTRMWPSYNTTVFKDVGNAATTNTTHWSSSAHSGVMWGVDLLDGQLARIAANGTARVRCVR